MEVIANKFVDVVDTSLSKGKMEKIIDHISRYKKHLKLLYRCQDFRLTKMTLSYEKLVSGTTSRYN